MCVWFIVYTHSKSVEQERMCWIILNVNLSFTNGDPNTL